MFTWVLGFISPLMGSSFKLSPLYRFKFKSCNLPHESGLGEVELHLLGRIQIVQNHETLRKLASLQLSKVNGLGAECSHGAVISQMRSADGHILKELFFDWLLILKMVTSSAQSQEVVLNAGTFNIAYFDWQIKAVVF